MGDALALAWRRLSARGLEAVLTLAAIGLAVAVLTTVAAVLGVTERARARLGESLSAREGVIRAAQDDPFAFEPAGEAPLDVRLVGSIYGPTVRFTYEDLAALKAAPSVRFAYARGFKQFESDAWDGTLTAASVTADYLAALPVRVVAGSLPTASDFEEQRPVILLTRRFARQLGMEGDLVGQSVMFAGEEAPFTVVGVLPEVDGEALSVREALVPFRPEREPVREIWFAVDDPSRLPQAVSEVEAFAGSRWEGAVSVTSQRDATAAFLARQRSRAISVAVLAAVALAAAVGNVLALMLARVARRQREIGVARSLGATRAGVAGAVMLDAGLLGVVGAAVGVAAGRALLAGYNRHLAANSSVFGVSFSFSVEAALLATGAAVFLCLIAGLYPGVVAARLRVVDALGGAQA